MQLIGGLQSGDGTGGKSSMLANSHERGSISLIILVS